MSDLEIYSRLGARLSLAEVNLNGARVLFEAVFEGVEEEDSEPTLGLLRTMAEQVRTMNEEVREARKELRERLAAETTGR